MYSTEEQNDLSDWEEHYQRMSLDDRILLELQSIGLLTEQTVSIHLPLYCSMCNFLQSKLGASGCTKKRNLCSHVLFLCSLTNHVESRYQTFCWIGLLSMSYSLQS